jgi:kynureninase
VTAFPRAQAEALDAADELAPFRDRFVLGDAERIYADGNSLGRLPRDTAARLDEAVRSWGDRLVEGWADWIELPRAAGDRLAALLGADPGEVLACDSTTVNLYKLAHAVLDARPRRGAVVTDAANFPTDRYVLEGVAARHGLELRLFDGDPVDGPSAADVERVLASGGVTLLSLSHVAYRSGALADMRAITAVARAADVPLVWDLSHSAGAVPVDLASAGAELAVGCTYKYLNAGPGAPAYLYVARGLHQRLRSPVWGWFGQRDQFAMGPQYEPVEGIERFHAGTPAVLGLVSVLAGADLVLEAGIEALRRKSLALTSLTTRLADERLARHDFRVVTPRLDERRGGHVALAHADAWRICRALIERAGVVPDYRAPDAIRLAFPPLYSRFADVWDAVDRLERLVASGGHLAVAAEPRRVT